MRTSLLLAAIVATLGLAASAMAAENYQEMTDYSAGACDTCGHGGGRHGCRLHRGGHGGCGHFGNRNRYEGLDRSFNCGCVGSYKFPVPPQNTYFWPGSVYSMELMTNYHSPWRFPPLKPYTEEVLAPLGADNDIAPSLRPVSATEELEPQTLPGQPETMSSAMQRFFR